MYNYMCVCVLDGVRDYDEPSLKAKVDDHVIVSSHCLTILMRRSVGRSVGRSIGMCSMRFILLAQYHMHAPTYLSCGTTRRSQLVITDGDDDDYEEEERRSEKVCRIGECH